MISHIPSLISHPIEREGLFDDAPAKHPIERHNEEVREKQEALEEHIRTLCSVFAASCPAEWRAFEESLISIYGYAHALDQRTPFDFLGIQKENGMPIDSNYYALTKAYASGQVHLLDAMFRVMKISPERLRAYRAPKLAPENFFKKLLTALRKWM